MGACVHAINPKSETSGSVRNRVAIAFVLTFEIRLECVCLLHTNIVTFCAVLSIFICLFVIIPCKHVLGSDPPVVAVGREKNPKKNRVLEISGAGIPRTPSKHHSILARSNP